LSKVIQTLREKDFVELKTFSIPENLIFNLKSTINQLLEFILERELKSVSVMNSIK
jgi:flagellar basal body-associated protein FliL